jgi:hypothetical protein
MALPILLIVQNQESSEGRKVGSAVNESYQENSLLLALSSEILFGYDNIFRHQEWLSE